MISSGVRSHTTIKYKASEDSQTTKAKATASTRHDSSVLSRAIAAQRLELFEQPSSSKDLRLIALDKLQQRGFRPALGGLEIPLTGKAMGGMPKRINAYYYPGAASESTRQEFGGPAAEKQQEINDKKEFIAELREELAAGGTTEVQTRLNRQALQQAQNELATLQAEYRRIQEQARQAERGRR